LLLETYFLYLAYFITKKRFAKCHWIPFVTLVLVGIGFVPVANATLLYTFTDLGALAGTIEFF
jgi:hypothetical protein